MLNSGPVYSILLKSLTPRQIFLKLVQTKFQRDTFSSLAPTELQTHTHTHTHTHTQTYRHFLKIVFLDSGGPKTSRKNKI